MIVTKSFPDAFLSPLPICCIKTVEDNVGRKNSKRFISGISTPSFKISTTHSISIFPFLKFSKILDRSVKFVLDVNNSDLYSFFKNSFFIYNACFIF